MALTSFVCLFAVLITLSPLPWYVSAVFSAVTAPVASLTELFTKKGWDTVTVPIASALILCFSMI